MPNLDGLGLLQALRQNRTTQRMGFILVTGSVTPEVVKHGQALALNNILRKPFTTASMRHCIESVVGKL